MRDFAILFKTLYKEFYARREGMDGRKKLSQRLVMLFSFIPLAAIIIAMLVFMTLGVRDIRTLASLSASVVGAVQIFILMTSLFSITSTLYSAKDAQLLSTLPIRHSTVFFAKFSLLYIDALQFSACLVVPFLLATTITFNIVNGWVFYGFYPLILIVALATPVLPLFIVTLFSMPIVWIGTYFKGRATLKSVFTILFYILIMCAYLVLVFYLQTKGFGQDGETVDPSMLSSIGTLANVLYPDKVMLYAFFGIEAGKNFGIFLAIEVGMIAVMLLFASLFYKRIKMKRAESVSADKGKNTALKQSGIVASLMAKDFKSIMRNSTLAMSSLANLIMAPLFVVLTYFITKAQAGEEMLPLFDYYMNVGYVLMYSSIFLAGANMLSGMAYTREGASFFASKALPIAPKDSIKAKVLLTLIVDAIVLVVIAILTLAILKIDAVSVLLLTINVLLICVGVCSLGVLFDMKRGNMHWKDMTEFRNASRNNFYLIITTFVAVLYGCLMFVLGILLGTVFVELGDLITKVIYWSVATAVSAIICVIGAVLLKTYGEKFYAMIGEYRPQKKAPKNTMSKGGLLK